MAEMIEFDVLPEEHELKYAGMCVLLYGPITPYSSRCFPRGCRSKIQLNKANRQYLSSLTWDENCMYEVDVDDFDYQCVLEDTDQLLRLRFFTAETIVHEIGHALQNAAFGTRNGCRELFYCGSKVAEAGCELVAQIFGGIIQNFCNIDGAQFPGAYNEGRRRSAAGPMQIQNWPSFYITERYEQLYEQPVWSGIPFATHDVLWNIPGSFFESLFTNEFWESLRHRNDAESLYPPRESSWPFYTPDLHRDPQPIPLHDLEQHFGVQRTRMLCSGLAGIGTASPDYHDEDWAEYFASLWSNWFEELLKY